MFIRTTRLIGIIEYKCIDWREYIIFKCNLKKWRKVTEYNTFRIKDYKISLELGLTKWYETNISRIIFKLRFGVAEHRSIVPYGINDLLGNYLYKVRYCHWYWLSIGSFLCYESIGKLKKFTNASLFTI